MLTAIVAFALFFPTAAQQRSCPQAGLGAPTASPFPAAPAAGVGSAADVLGARARASQPHRRAAASPAPRTPPLRVSNTTACMAAALMYEFSLAVLPSRAPLLDVFESLKLDVDCGATPPPPPPPPGAGLRDPQRGLDAAERRQRCPAREFHVVPRGGSAFPAAPAFATVGAALAALRAARAADGGAARPACVVLHPGVHYLGRTVELGAFDSSIVFTALGEAGAGAPAWVSGGVELLGLPGWAPHNVTPDGSSNIWVTTVPPAVDLRLMPALNALEPHVRLINSQFPNYNPEVETLEVPGPWGGGGAVSEWVKPALFPRPTVFWKSLEGLKNDSTMDCYNHFSTGSGGPCAHWKGKGSEWNYYCGNSSDGGWVEVDAYMESEGLLLFPLAMTYNSTFVPNLDAWRLPPLADAGGWELEGNGPVLTVWQGAPGGGGEWYNNRFAIISHDPATRTLNLSADGVWPAGGWQGGRTWHTLDAPSNGNKGPLIGGSWHVNGIFAELDWPGEYYFNTSTRQLFMFFNTSLVSPPLPPASPPPSSLVLVAPQLEVFFNLTGSPSAPVADVQFVGLGFRDQRPAMMDAWVVPSGGDWALRRAGAVHLEGTVRANVSGCSFFRTDANAVMVSGYNRNATVEDSAFTWLGMSAIALMGDCEQDDCTAAEQPWGTVVSGCVFSELGTIEKQSSAVFLAKAALTRVEGSLMFNGPRAMINFNDGMGGGHNVSGNAIWNTCRESGDHGPLNSWNRIPYASRVATGGGDATYAAALSEVHHNYVDAAYGGSQAFE